MKKSIFRIVLVFLCLILVVGIVPGQAAAATAAGKPKNLTWGKAPVYVADADGFLEESTKQYNIPGMVTWKGSEPDTGVYLVTAVKENSPWEAGYWEYTIPVNGWYYSDVFYSNVEESGTYHFTVQTMGDDYSYSDSSVVTSSSWTYTKPSKKLPGFTNVKWDGREPTYNKPTDSKMVGYQIYYYYQADLAADLEQVRDFSRFDFSSTDMLSLAHGLDSLGQIFPIYGDGYYYFKIRALSRDITSVFHSDWSELSEPYHFVRSKTENISNADYSLSDLSKGSDGYYRTPDGQLVYIAVDNTNDAGLLWLDGYTLFDYVEDFGNELFDTTHWTALKAKMDQNGYVLLNDETLNYLRVTVLGNPAWGDAEDCIPYYLFYDKAASAEIKTGDVTRLAGENRLVTSYLVADQLKAKMGVSKFDSVIVASGSTFADALPGSYLSARKNAPILLTLAKDKYVKQTADYIKANLKSGGTVYILGGESAVPASMEKALSGYNVQRVAGSDRFGTNLAILNTAGIKDGDEILVCTAKDYADSLSASAAGKPILLVYKKLTDAQKAFLDSRKGKNSFCLVGGTAAVPESFEKELKTYGDVTRLAGKDRLETSVLVAKKYFPNAKTAVVAYGWDFPDGLCGGSLAYATKSPLILTHSKEKLYKFTADYTAKAGLKAGYVLGGSGLVSDAATKAIFSMGSGNITVLK